MDVEIKKCSTAASGDNGAGVYVSSSSTVTLDRCKLHQNYSPDDGNAKGTALYSEGNLTMTNCLIYDNQCDAGEDVITLVL